MGAKFDAIYAEKKAARDARLVAKTDAALEKEFAHFTDAQLNAEWLAIDGMRVKSGPNKGQVKIIAAKRGDRILAETKRRRDLATAAQAAAKPATFHDTRRATAASIATKADAATTPMQRASVRGAAAFRSGRFSDLQEAIHFDGPASEDRRAAFRDGWKLAEIEARDAPARQAAALATSVAKKSGARHFAAKLGDRIYFRKSPTRIYTGVTTTGGGSVSFTAQRWFDAPTVEVTKEAYARLVELKHARVVEDGRRPLDCNAPLHSWVRATPEALAALQQRAG